MLGLTNHHDNILQFPLVAPKDVLDRLSLPPPKDLDVMLLDSMKPTSTSKGNLYMHLVINKNIEVTILAGWMGDVDDNFLFGTIHLRCFKNAHWEIFTHLTFVLQVNYFHFNPWDKTRLEIATL